MPIYLLAGGPGSRRSGPDPLLQQIFGGTGKAAPSIAYVGAASNDDAGFFKWLSTFFKQSGAGTVTLAATAAPHVNIKKTIEILKEADLIFITGGDVEVGMARLHKHALAPLLHRLYASGKPFFGLSAGSIMLAQSWVRWPDPDDDHSAEAFDCLGFAPILCDMHAESDDWVELKALLGLQAKGTLGYGIPSGAGLRIEPNGTLTALGGKVIRLQQQGNDIKELKPLEVR